MIRFKRYRHIHDLYIHYADQENRADIIEILKSGLQNADDAEALCRFTWKIAELINFDEEHGNVVFGSTDNTEMLADLSCEISKPMRSRGYEAIWQRISDAEME